MGKLAFSAIGTLGVGAAGTGGFFLLKELKTPKAKFKDRYSHALITDTDNLWDSKFSLLKAANPEPKHPQLLQALRDSKESSKESGAKELMKRVCVAMYEEEIKVDYVKDFEKYCVKNNKDVSKIAWNDEANSSSKWDSSLTTLKSHDYGNNGMLDKELNDLKTKISSLSNYENTHREELKKWCEKVKEHVYWGPQSKEFKQQELYCKKNQ
ncbi:hypothetical protein MHC_02105 [Mycoplasma haemocanis str. Illinois]|uniref:Uncharacterized protein n=1 Tax=Mycoplasma haemocanis (strain Illinois) TaxID=1111676 RepID=H6N6L5_MYCHN|nr:hypothetical protein [Mycoplasma haemocanis]AEW45287.1 hypothetical protein MHC_02105 [Mycoplasma haemocanis str. Illinois]